MARHRFDTRRATRSLALACAASFACPLLAITAQSIWGLLRPDYEARRHFLAAMQERGGFDERGPPRGYQDPWGNKAWFDWDASLVSPCPKYWHSTGPNGVFGDPDDVRYLKAGWDLGHEVYRVLPALGWLLAGVCFLPLLGCCYAQRRHPLVEAPILGLWALFGAVLMHGWLSRQPVLDYWGGPPAPSLATSFAEARGWNAWVPTRFGRAWLVANLAVAVLGVLATGRAAYLRYAAGADDRDDFEAAPRLSPSEP